MLNNLILSFNDFNVVNSLKKLNYNLINTQEVDFFLPLENRHADMQCLIIDNKAFVIDICTDIINSLSNEYDIITISENLEAKYPHNIALNALVINNYLIGKCEYISKEVLYYCQLKDYKLINVNQGYTRCSCAIVDNKSIITEDESIYKALSGTNIDVLKIDKGFVKLDGAEYGFIGGASGKISCDTLFFCGDITKHPNYKDILSFCNTRNVKIEYIKDKELIDIGGILLC